MALKAHVIQRIETNNHEIILETHKLVGKYGRYIGTIILADSDVTVNYVLVQKGLTEYVTY